MIHRKELEIHDFLNYRTLKPGGEIVEVIRRNISVRIENQSQSKPRLCGNQTIGGFNELRYRGLARKANREFTALMLVNSYLPAGK